MFEIYEIMPHDMKMNEFLLPESFFSFQNPGIGLTAKKYEKNADIEIPFEKSFDSLYGNQL